MVDDGTRYSNIYGSDAVRRTVDSLAQNAENVSLAGAQLLEGARKMLQARHRTANLIPKGIIKDTAWDMLLELFINGEEGGVIYVKQLILASGQSAASAIRLIERLEYAGLIFRRADPLDQRRVIVRLSERGRLALVCMLSHIFDPQPAVSGSPVSFKPRR